MELIADEEKGWGGTKMKQGGGGGGGEDHTFPVLGNQIQWLFSRPQTTACTAVVGHKGRLKAYI
jgi:hypothetical protein